MDAVTSWAKQEHVRLETVRATGLDQLTSATSRAIDLAPDLVICAGKGVVNPLALVTPTHFDRQFPAGGGR